MPTDASPEGPASEVAAAFGKFESFCLPSNMAHCPNQTEHGQALGWWQETLKRCGMNGR